MHNIQLMKINLQNTIHTTNVESYQLPSDDINYICHCGDSTTNSRSITIMNTIYVLICLFAILMCIGKNGIDLEIESLCIHDIIHNNFDIIKMSICIKTMEIIFCAFFDTMFVGFTSDSRE